MLLKQCISFPYIPSRTYVNWTGKFENNQFIYHADKNVYVCPNGKELTHSTSDPHTQRHAYFAKKMDCRSCSLREQCTTSKTGRKVIRSFYRDEYERLMLRIEARSRKVCHEDTEDHYGTVVCRGKGKSWTQKVYDNGESTRRERMHMLLRRCRTSSDCSKHSIRRMTDKKVQLCELFCSMLTTNQNKSHHFIFDLLNRQTFTEPDLPFIKKTLLLPTRS